MKKIKEALKTEGTVDLGEAIKKITSAGKVDMFSLLSKVGKVVKKDSKKGRDKPK